MEAMSSWLLTRRIGIVSFIYIQAKSSSSQNVATLLGLGQTGETQFTRRPWAAYCAPILRAMLDGRIRR
jgi:hypothetical protein